VCGWFTSGWLRITIPIESCSSSIFSSMSLHRLRSITNKCWRITRTSTHREVAKDRMWIGHSIIGGYRMSPSYLLWSHDRMILPSIIRTWGGWTRQDGYNLVQNEHWEAIESVITAPPRSLWMSWHMYHIHTRMPERLAFNQTIYSYLNSSHNLCYRIKNIYVNVSFSQEYSHRHWLAYDVRTFMVRQTWITLD
jgi:hypothetical protein